MSVLCSQSRTFDRADKSEMKENGNTTMKYDFSKKRDKLQLVKILKYKNIPYLYYAIRIAVTR